MAAAARLHGQGAPDGRQVGRLPQTTVTLRAVFRGVELHVVQEGIPALIPTEACYLGGQESLVLLGQLVEAQVSQ